MKFERKLDSWEIICIKMAIREYIENNQENNTLFNEDEVIKTLEIIYDTW